jgi:hypothetical protein
MHMTMLLNRSDGRLDELALIGSEPFSMQWTNELRRNIGLHPSCAQLVSDFGIPVTRFRSGAITSSDLDRIKFGGARLLFDPEPLLFD